ncbi:MAG TPA: hypothetical protein VF456_26240 [Vicinamibacterales bacterium]
MRPGTTLHRLARLTCSSDRCNRVLEPALADLQHYWSTSRSWSELLRNYAVFWQSWGTCLLQDVIAPESRSFSTAAVTAFALTVAGTALLELVLMHGSIDIRRRIISVSSRVACAAMFDTATLRYGVPLAIGPTLLYATWRTTTRVAPAAYLTAAALGMFVTVLASGWIAPALIRYDMTQQHDGYARWAAHAPSSSTQGWYVPPLDFSWFAPAKPFPELILGAIEPLRRQSELMPLYVTPDEEKRSSADRREIFERLFLVLLAFASAVVGATIGRFATVATAVEVIDGPFS